MTMRELISHLPAALPWASLISGAVLVLSKLLKELRGIIHACTFRHLGKALVEKANWTDAATVRIVLTLMRDMDRNAAKPPSVADKPARTISSDAEQ
jgi:hypothetical protein